MQAFSTKVLTSKYLLKIKWIDKLADYKKKNH